jgi:hypothetical protein
MSVPGFFVGDAIVALIRGRQRHAISPPGQVSDSIVVYNGKCSIGIDEKPSNGLTNMEFHA